MAMTFEEKEIGGWVRESVSLKPSPSTGQLGARWPVKLHAEHLARESAAINFSSAPPLPGKAEVVKRIGGK